MPAAQDYSADLRRRPFSPGTRASILVPAQWGLLPNQQMISNTGPRARLRREPTTSTSSVDAPRLATPGWRSACLASKHHRRYWGIAGCAQNPSPGTFDDSSRGRDAQLRLLLRMPPCASLKNSELTAVIQSPSLKTTRPAHKVTN